MDRNLSISPLSPPPCPLTWPTLERKELGDKKVLDPPRALSPPKALLEVKVEVEVGVEVDGCLGPGSRVEGGRVGARARALL